MATDATSWSTSAGGPDRQSVISRYTYVTPDDREAEVTTTVTVEQQVTVRERLRLGATAMPGKPTVDLLAAMPGIQYMRDFGKDGSDSDSLPELPAHGTGKMALPEAMLVHVSWKDDVEQLKPWLDGLARPIWLTWWHEPMGDMSPSAYRSTAARMVDIIRAHPNGRLVRHNGPIVTRWWLDQKGGNPADWWYEGATCYGTDVYNDSTTRYRDAEEMFGSAARIARERGVPWLVPEYGIERLAADTTGVGRATVIREHVAWLRQQRDCLAVGWWNIGGDVITGLEPEHTVWRDALTAQA